MCLDLMHATEVKLPKLDQKFELIMQKCESMNESNCSRNNLIPKSEVHTIDYSSKPVIEECRSANENRSTKDKHKTENEERSGKRRLISRDDNFSDW